MQNTATMMRPSELEQPFWKSSQTNLPSPGFCATISAAISTIQPIHRLRRRQVKNNVMADGLAIYHTVVNHPWRRTLPTFTRYLSMEDTRTAVLINVGHMQNSVTVIAEVR